MQERLRSEEGRYCIANGSGWRSRRSGGSSTYWLPALQFAGPPGKFKRSGKLVCAALNPEENRGPDHLLTTTGKAAKPRCEEEGNQSAVPGRATRRKHTRSFPENVLWDKLLTPVSETMARVREFPCEGPGWMGSQIGNGNGLA